MILTPTVISIGDKNVEALDRIPEVVHIGVQMLNESEPVTANDTDIAIVNLTAFVNQTDDSLIGFRPLDPSYCDRNPQSPFCKTTIDPPPINKCIKKPELCNPCRDPTAYCPQPRDPLE